MASAPVPVFNSLGEEIRPWAVRIDYMPSVDKIQVSVDMPGGRLRPSKTYRAIFANEDLEDAIAAAQVAIRTAGARRLF